MSCFGKKREKRNLSVKPKSQIVFNGDDFNPQPLQTSKFVAVDYNLPKLSNPVN